MVIKGDILMSVNVINLNDKRLDGVTKKIKEVVSGITKDFMYIGFLLWECREYEYYLEDGYENVYDYVEREFKFKSTKTKELIQVCASFSRLSSTGSPSMHIADKYKDFNFTQLKEMVSLPVSELIKITPDMSSREIKELKKELKEKGRARDQGEKEERQITVDEVCCSVPVQESVASIFKIKQNEIVCENCGKSYIVDKDKRNSMWIKINNKYVGNCCFNSIWDNEILEMQHKRG